MKITAKTVGERIRELRELRKLTQDQLAKAVGIKQGSMTQLETGKSKAPSSKTLTKLARVFEVDPEWLMTGKGPQQAIATFSDQESELILMFRALSSEGQNYILGRAKAIHSDEHQQRGPNRRRDDDRADPPKPKTGH